MNADLVEMIPKIRERAAELVEQGWCQGAFARTEFGLGVCWFDSERASVCLVGAISVATEEILGERDDDAIGVREAIEWALHRELGAPIGLVEWNDHATRTAEEVAAALRGKH